jgi:hypothetical protein
MRLKRCLARAKQIGHAFQPGSDDTHIGRRGGDVRRSSEAVALHASSPPVRMAAAYRPAQGSGTATCRPDGVVVYHPVRDHGRGRDGGRLSEYTRREVLKQSAALAGGIAPVIAPARVPVTAQSGRTIRFGIIGLNHGHIYAQTEALRRAGGQLVSVYAGEPELAQAFAQRFPEVRLARSRQEILEDSSIQLVVSAAIPVDRAPLGIEVMRSGKDFMSDKPGVTTIDQLAEVRRVQAETRRIYSIMFNERFESAATVKASALVQGGAIGTPL